MIFGKEGNKMNKRYKVIFDTENYTGSCGSFDTLQEGLDTAITILEGWMTDERFNWKFENGIPKPTPKQIEDWNYMIDTCEAYVVDTEYQGDNPEMRKEESYYWLDGHYYPALEIAESLGWKYWEE